MTDQQGHTAATNGAIFENIIKRNICEVLDISCLNHGEDPGLAKSVLWKNVPYESIYGTKCRSEFCLDLNGKRYRIECKFQKTGGSVDEKLPYLMLNFTQQVPEEETIIIIDGPGFRDGAVKWLRQACEGTKCKVFSTVEFLVYLETLR